MTTLIGDFTVQDQATIRDNELRTIRNGLIQNGIANPNVGPNSDYYISATAHASELAVVQANCVIKCDEQMPDTATGPALDRWLAIVGLKRQPAAGALGNITLSSIATCAIVSGSQLIDTAGLVFQVTTSGNYANGATLPIAAISTGIQTNHLNSDVLTWVTPPAFANPTATVGLTGGTDGLTGGVNAEDDQTASARLLATLANPPASGNWQHCANIAEASSPYVQKAFVYPAAQGPASLAIIVAGFSTAALSGTIVGPSANRDINTTVVSSIIAPYITGILPEHAAITVGTVSNVLTDVAFGLSLPASPQANPAGPGGGWVDGSPWPMLSGTIATSTIVTGVTSTTVFTVSALTPPTPNVSHIAYLNPANWQVYSAKVLSFTGTTGAYVITIDTPMVGIATGNYIWPQSVNQQAYVTAALTAFAQMGPGEVTSSPTILQRAFRHPLPQLSWPYAMSATQLRALENVGPEVLTATYYSTSASTPGIPGGAPNTANILVPRNIGFYQI